VRVRSPVSAVAAGPAAVSTAARQATTSVTDDDKNSHAAGSCRAATSGRQKPHRRKDRRADTLPVATMSHRRREPAAGDLRLMRELLSSAGERPRCAGQDCGFNLLPVNRKGGQQTDLLSDLLRFRNLSEVGQGASLGRRLPHRETEPPAGQIPRLQARLRRDYGRRPPDRLLFAGH
jgi:hypothetical protein